MTSLWKEAYKDFDLQYQHHVTIFLGACVRACVCVLCVLGGGGVSACVARSLPPVVSRLGSPWRFGLMDGWMDGWIEIDHLTTHHPRVITNASSHSTPPHHNPPKKRQAT
jgi:hypothetical protein